MAEKIRKKVKGELTKITKRKRIEEAKEIYEFIVNTSKEFMTMINKNYVYAAANDAYCKAHNKKREEIVGHTVKDIWGEEIFNKIIKKYLDKCFTGEEVIYQEWFEFPGLGKRYFEVTYYPYRSNGGMVTHGVVVTRDITERSQVDEKLRQSEEKYRTIMENTLDIIYACSPEGIVTFVSPQVLSYGYSTKEIIGHKISEFIHPEDIDKAMDGFQRTMQTGETFPTILRLRRKNGTYIGVNPCVCNIKL